MLQFRTRQTEAKRKTVWLVLLYAALLLVFGFIAAYGVTYVWDMFDPVRSGRFWDGKKWVYETSDEAYLRFLIVMLVVPVVVWGLSLLSPAARGAGGKNIAESLDGTLVSPQTRSFAERRLLNVVEEMAIASGMPVPPVYVLENEHGINAFAAGKTPNDAVIGVTRGTLEYLDREELQAVVAHEFSHVLNQDMRLNMRFACLLFGLMCIAEVGKVLIRGLSRSRPRSSGKNSGQGLALLFAIAFACFLIGLITHFFGTIIQAAVNRQREFLADASAVQFTRSPGLASALKKIGGLAEGSKLTETGMASNYSHFFFCSAANSLFSSHPPLAARIKRIEPQWDGVYPTARSQAIAEEPAYEPSGPDPARMAGVAVAARILSWNGQDADDSTGTAPGAPSPETATMFAWADSGLADVQKLASTPQNMPESLAKLTAACHEPLDSCYMIFGLLLDADPAVRAKQVASCDSEEARMRMQEYAEAFALVDPEEYLPLIERAVPALKRLSPAQYKAFYGIMRDLVFADEEMSFEEWILYRLVSSQVGAQYTGESAAVAPSDKELEEATVTVLAALARLDTDGAIAEKAFEACLEAFAMKSRKCPARPAIQTLDKSLTVLQRGREEWREAFMLSAIMAVAADKNVTRREAMFLRVLSLCLEVPLTREHWTGSLEAHAEIWANIT